MMASEFRGRRRNPALGSLVLGLCHIIAVALDREDQATRPRAHVRSETEVRHIAMIDPATDFTW